MARSELFTLCNPIQAQYPPWPLALQIVTRNMPLTQKCGLTGAVGLNFETHPYQITEKLLYTLLWGRVMHPSKNYYCSLFLNFEFPSQLSNNFPSTADNVIIWNLLTPRSEHLAWYHSSEKKQLSVQGKLPALYCGVEKKTQHDCIKTHKTFSYYH